MYHTLKQNIIKKTDMSQNNKLFPLPAKNMNMIWQMMNKYK